MNNFNDFTHKHYEDIILSAKKNYDFCTFNKNLFDKDSRIIICRHDIDISVYESLNLAKIENKHGIKSIYYLLLHSEFYNLFEKSVKLTIDKIISLGHEIGLHFDPTFYAIKNKFELEKYIEFEKQILEKAFDFKIKSFSFHNPTEDILKYDDFYYSGLINTYSKEIKKNINYCSDSNGYWRFKRMFDVVDKEKPRKLQILTHPVWWTKEVMSPKDKVWYAIDNKSKLNKSFYIESMGSYNRKIITQ